jgi:rod shape-determining protein MreC
LEASKTNGTIVGSAGGALVLDLILKETQLRPGEIVLTSGLDGVFPQGLLVGEISKVFDNSTASFKKASVLPFFNRRDLKQVFVLISN